MKLSEITKKGFLDVLKNPHKALIRRKIKEIRQLIKPKGWVVYTSYNKQEDVFTLRFYSVYNNLNPNVVYKYTEQNVAKKSEILRDIWSLFPSNIDIMIDHTGNQDAILHVKGSIQEPV